MLHAVRAWSGNGCEAIVQGKVCPDEFYVFKPTLELGKFAILERKLGVKNIMMVYSTEKNLHKSIKDIPVPKSKQNQFCINDDEVQLLAKQSLLIEKHYGK